MGMLPPAPTPAEHVRASAALQGWADLIWVRIRQEIYELVQKLIDEAFEARVLTGDLCNFACSAGVPGTQIVASGTIPFSTLVIPFKCVCTTIQTYAYPAGSTFEVSIEATPPGLAPQTVMEGRVIPAGSTLNFYVTGTLNTEVGTVNVLVRTV